MGNLLAVRSLIYIFLVVSHQTQIQGMNFSPKFPSSGCLQLVIDKRMTLWFIGSLFGSRVSNLHVNINQELCMIGCSLSSTQLRLSSIRWTKGYAYFSIISMITSPLDIVNVLVGQLSLWKKYIYPSLLRKIYYFCEYTTNFVFLCMHLLKLFSYLSNIGQYIEELPNPSIFKLHFYQPSDIPQEAYYLNSSIYLKACDSQLH